MKALTLHRPWAGLIAAGLKPVENRGWVPPASLLGQRLAIHAGKRWDRDGALWAFEQVERTAPQFDPGGLFERAHAEGIVAVVTVAGWFRSPSEWRTMDGLPPRMSELGSPWFLGPIVDGRKNFGWILRERAALPDPVACKGAQGLWSLSPEVEAQVREQRVRAGGGT